ncbi:transporter, major facilitator family protein [Brevibacterium mcbrellneri ATCC 49030]|uniref:Transporter, major facilitator family protein n=1 Tax=Brevibacterium mcbrellneri ATCC 49030 TaxID=585530 RepID=D4YN26_9MICO|nr:transporter, major facilitator family protein [Brevibacterium mcbrellneri ATCC 49030]
MFSATTNHPRRTTTVSTTDKLYSALVKREAEADMPEQARSQVASNGLKLIAANALQSSGDQTVNASTVLPWLFSALGVPPALAGLLVPIRESGSMLPQAALTPLVVKARYRKHVFVAGALTQAASVAVMTGTAVFASGLVAGLIIIAALAVFSFGRCLCSIASKDVQGRTIPKGERGQINGLATTVAGFVAITLGLAIRVWGGDDLTPQMLAWILGLGAVLWVGVAAVYIGIDEPSDTESSKSASAKSAPAKATQDAKASNWFNDTIDLLRTDKLFRHFFTVRSLLLVSSLSPPFIVMLSVQSGASGLTGLGGFVIASGLASLLGGRIFGRFADKSSKRLMSIGAGIASAIILATILIASIPALTDQHTLISVAFVVAYFLITLMHTGVRVGRKTYVVDMAEGDKRTTYVAVSNSAMGLILLIVGGVSSALATIHVFYALGFLAIMGLVGVFAGTSLPDVSRKK